MRTAAPLLLALPLEEEKLQQEIRLKISSPVPEGDMAQHRCAAPSAVSDCGGKKPSGQWRGN